MKTFGDMIGGGAGKPVMPELPDDELAEDAESPHAEAVAPMMVDFQAASKRGDTRGMAAAFAAAFEACQSQYGEDEAEEI